MIIILLWIRAFFTSALIFALFFLYSLYEGRSPSLRLTNSVSAYTGITLVILSFAIGNVAYFFPVFTRFIKYRKEIGLTGFFIVVLHILFSLVILQDVFPFPDAYIHGKSLFSFIAAVIATLIITTMALVSNTFAIKHLGKWWRRVLRIGYAAVFLSLLHMILRDSRTIESYTENILTPPPLSLIVMWFGLWTIILRFCLYFMTKKHSTHV